MKRVALLISVLCLLLGGAFCYAQTKIRAKGTAGIHKSFVQIARDRAIDNAKRQAVEQAVRVFIQSETLVENYQLVYDRIFSKYSGYVNAYEILEEKQEADQYRVTIEADVGTADLKQTLDAILPSVLAAKSNPRLMVLFQQRAQKDFMAEGTMIQYFLSKGFKVVDSDVIRNNLAAERIETLGYDKRAAAQIGQRYGAEIMIVGDVATSSHLFRLGEVEIYANRAIATAKVIKSDTGDIMATGSEEHKLPGIKDMIKEPVEKASLKLAENLTKKLVNWWQNELNNVVTVKLVINGLESYGEITKLKKTLSQEVRGIKSLNDRYFGDGRVEFDVELRGKIQYLANDLMNSHPDGKSFTIKRQSANVLVVELK